MIVLAVDPGARYTGAAVGVVADDDPTWLTPFVAGTYATELRTAQAMLDRWSPDVVVVEGFLLQPKANLAFDDLQVVRQVGIWQYVTETYGARYVEQLPAVKVPARALCRTRGVTFLPNVGDVHEGDHHIDAQLHLWTWHMRRNT